MIPTPQSRRRKKRSSDVPPFWNSAKAQADDISSLVRKSVEVSALIDSEREYLSQRAPNALEWITRKEFLNQPAIYGYWGAYSLVKEFFELRCPDCNQGPNAVPRIPWTPGRPQTGLSRSTLESEVLLCWSSQHEDDVCPKCQTTRGEFVDRGDFNNHRVLHAIVGQRSGKTTVLAQIGTYLEHIFYTLAITHPGGLHAYLGVAPGAPLDVSYVASTAVVSKLTIWAAYRGARANSPWFKRYIPWVKWQEKIQQTPEGMQPWEYHETDRLIENGLAGVNTDSLNSNSNGLVGRTRLFAAIDEISRMEQTDGARSGIEVYRAMVASCKTVQNRVDHYGLFPWLGMIGSISSPISLDDYGMELLKQAKEDPRMFPFHAATWDFNPEEPLSAYATDLKKDYVGIMRNFGASPPGAANPLIDRPEDFKASAIRIGLVPTAFFETYEFTDRTGVSYVASKLEKSSLLLNSPQRYVTVDAGKNFDAFAVACAHGEEDENGEIITVYDWVIRLLTRSKQQEVYFRSIFTILKELQKYYLIKRVGFDQWNSVQIIQDIRNELGIFAEAEVTKKEHFVQFMRDAYSGRVQLLPELPNDAILDPPYKSAQGALIYELLKLERDPKTDAVFNSKKGEVRGMNSDDTARVAVHVHHLVQDQGYTEKQDDVSRRARRKRAEASTAEWTALNRGQVFRPPQASSPKVPSGGAGRKW